MTETIKDHFARLPPSPGRRFLRLPDVERKSGMKRSSIYAAMKEGKFPQSVLIAKRTVGWDSLDIDRWIEARVGGRDAHIKALREE